ncbi:MAG: hypothetical protein OHK0038_23870 [Flammeovirgaceae bacterium]
MLTVSCSDGESISADNGGNQGSGQGGSLARFAISGDYLYTVDNELLKTLDISNPQKPIPSSTTKIGFNIETIFSRGNTLFIGSQNGMYIYDLQNPSTPTKLSVYQHIVSCDPVVADSKYAYVTLRTGTNCFRGVNLLEIIDIQDLTNPTLITSYPMTNPKGLGIDNTTLFVCDDGLKVFDVSDVNNIVLKNHFNISATDVIARGGLLLVLGDEGIMQYQYVGDNLQFLSKISVLR